MNYKLSVENIKDIDGLFEWLFISMSLLQATLFQFFTWFVGAPNDTVYFIIKLMGATLIPRAREIQIIISSILLVVMAGISYFITLKVIHTRARALQNGLYVIEKVLSNYGTATTLAFSDMMIISRENIVIKEGYINPTFNTEIKKIGKRTSINNLMRRDYGEAGNYFPILQVFGMEFYIVVKNTFNVFSRYLIDNIERELLYMSIANLLIEGKNVNFICERISDTAKILQSIQLYLERRIRQLDEYVSLINYKNYAKFQSLKETDKMKIFRKELNDYKNHLLNWFSHPTKDTSVALSTWIDDHINNNPFQD